MNLVRSLATGAQHYIIVVPGEMAESMIGLGSNITVVKTDIAYGSGWGRFYWDQLTLRGIVQREKVDVIVSASDFGMFFPPCRQILMVRNGTFFSRLYLKKIFPLKSWRFKIDFLIRRWLISLSIRCSDIVMTASQAMLDDIKRFVKIPARKAMVNPFGVPLDKFGAEQNRRCGRANQAVDRECKGAPLRCLYVSEYSDYKNLTTLLESIRILDARGVNNIRLVTTMDPEQFPDVEVVSRDMDRKLASDPHITRCVKFAGDVPYEKIEKLYQESSVFLFPSIVESFGHPLVEAMASGLPVIASDIPVHHEICGEGALYFDPFDPADLADKIMLLRDDPLLRQNLGQSGIDRIRSRFNWNDHVKRFVNLLEKMEAYRNGEVE